MRELITRGRELAAELEECAATFHFKSDAHDILEYEAACVEARVNFLVSGVAVPENCRDSSLLGEWGSGLRADIPVLASKVRAFHEEFSLVLPPNNSPQR